SPTSSRSMRASISSWERSTDESRDGRRETEDGRDGAMSHGPSAAGGAALKPSHGHHDEPHVPVFVGETRAKLDELLMRYPTKQAALLPALWMLQEARGWVSEAGMAEIAGLLD